MSDPNPKLVELQNLTVAEIAEQVEGLSADELAELRSLEEADDKPRAGVLSAIEKAEAALAPEGANKNENDNAGARTASAAKAPDWRARDYDGPLTITQAAWRNEHIKPVRDVRTK